MKFLLLLVVLVVAYAAWRSARVRDSAAHPPGAAPRAPALPQEMVSCTVCAVHLPRADAVAGASGRLYCGGEHRRAGGD